MLAGLPLPAGAASTINTTQPVQGAPYNSAPIRQNFGAAAADIGALQSLNAGPNQPSAPVLGTLWLQTPQSGTTYYLKIWVPSANSWLTIGALNAAAGQWEPPIGGGSLPSITSGATTDLGTVPQATVYVTGSQSIASFGSSTPAGQAKLIIFTATPTLVYNATFMILPGNATIAIAAGQAAAAVSLGGGAWKVLFISGTGGTAVSITGAHGVDTAPSPITSIGVVELTPMVDNTVKGNPTNTNPEYPIDVPVPPCADTGGNHLNWITGTGFSCGTSSSGAAVSITATAPITVTPDPITGTGDISHDASGVVAASYTRANITVNATGHVTSAADGGTGVSVTAGTPDTVITPSPGTGTFTVGSTVPLNTQSGASYTILSTDNTKEVLRTNGSAMTDTVPQATGSFASGFSFGLQTGAAGDTLTPTTSTVNGLTATKMGAQQNSWWFSDGTNWKAVLGVPQPATQTGTTFLRDDMTWVAAGGGTGCNPGGIQYQVLVDDGAGACADTTIRDDNAIISAYLNPSFSGGVNDRVWYIDPLNDWTYMGDLAGNGADFSICCGIAFGANAFQNAATTYDGVAMGFGAGEDTTIDMSVVFLGSDAGSSSAGGDFQIGIGNSALASATITSGNAVAIGAGAGQGTAMTGGNFVAIGREAGANMTAPAGDDLIFVGNQAGDGQTGANDVVGIGYHSAQANTGSNVVGVGHGTGNSAGDFAVSVGFTAGNASAGDETVAVGSGAVSDQNTNQTTGTTPTGDQAIGVGYYAMAQTTGSNAIGIGNQAGYKNSGSNVIIISNADPGSNATSNYVDIAESLKITGTNTPTTSLVAAQGMISTNGYAIGSLPAAGVAGRRAYVTDQITACAAIGVAPTAGGALVCPVFDNGVGWVGG